MDGTCDRPAVLRLVKELLAAGHEVFIITGIFPEAGDWQNETAKLDKLVRLGLAKQLKEHIYDLTVLGNLRFHAVVTVGPDFDRDYRLTDIAFRKATYIEEKGIELMFDDSEYYIKMMPAFCGAQMVWVK